MYDKIIKDIPWIRTAECPPPDEGQLYICVELGTWIDGESLLEGGDDDEKLVKPIVTLNWGLCINNFPNDFPLYIPFLKQSSYLYKHGDELPDYPMPDEAWKKLTSDWIKNQVGIEEWKWGKTEMETLESDNYEE